MSEDRFLLVTPGETRPTRRPFPAAFAVKAATADTQGRLSLLEVVVAVDIPRHVHHDADEYVYVLDGTLAADHGNRTHEVPAGGFVLLPHGVPHALRRGSTPPPRVLQISAPGGWDDYLADLFDAGPAVFTDGRIEPARINPIAARHAITYEEPQRS